MLNFCDIIQVFVFTTNHHIKTLNIPSIGIDMLQQILQTKIRSDHLLFDLHISYRIKLKNQPSLLEQLW